VQSNGSTAVTVTYDPLPGYSGWSLFCFQARDSLTLATSSQSCINLNITVDAKPFISARASTFQVQTPLNSLHPGPHNQTPNTKWLVVVSLQSPEGLLFVRCPVISFHVMLFTLFCTQRSPPFPRSRPAPEDLHLNPLLGIGDGIQIARGSTARGYCQRLQAS
jgi:hypothetical protein